MVTLPVSYSALVQSDPEGSQSRQRPLTYDVTIVGGGLVGLTLACALRDSGLRVALIEACSESAAVLRGQAYHINLLSSRIFQGIGVWDTIQANVNSIDQISLSDADFPKTVRFLAQELNTPVLGYVAEHRVLLDALQSFLIQCPNVTYYCPRQVVRVQYQPEWVELETEQEDMQATIRTKLVVAADGFRSVLRQQAGISTRGWQYWQSCVVAFIKPEKSHQNVAYERFWPIGPFAILPLPDNLCRIVWTAPKAEAEAIAALNDQEFLARMKRQYGDQMGELSLAGGRYVFPVQLMHSNHYVLPRLALIGDAAHCCHPVGGQGVNLGIRDAAALAEVLTIAHHQGQDIGQIRVLRSYERWRKFESLVILGFTDLLVRLFSTSWLPFVVLRRLGLWVLNHVRPVRLTALRLMTGLLGRAPELGKG